MNLSHCLSHHCFLDQVVTSCMGFLMKGPWFTYAHAEISGGASFALFNKGIKTWGTFTSSRGTRFFERCCHSPEGFIELMQRGPRERESRYLQFTLQRPVDLIYTPHLLAHAVLTLDTGSPTILSRWDAATILQISRLCFTLWMSILLVCVVVNAAKFSVKKICPRYVNGCFLPQQALRKVKTN